MDKKRIERMKLHTTHKSKQCTIWSSKQYISEKYTHDSTERQLILTRLTRYKQSDIKKGFYDNNLTYDWFFENIYINPCYYCGTLEFRRGADRIDNSKGHSKDNVIPCCGLCNNTRMNNFTVSEMKLLGEVISTIRKNRN